MAEEIPPSTEGWERLKDSLDLKKSGSNHHPKHQVDIVVQYEGRSGSRTVEGTLISVKGSLEQDKVKREQNRYNGWFGKVRTSDGFLNVYADPDHGGPRIIFTPGWDGRGGRRYKWPIQNIVVEEKEGTDPQCFKCCSSMEYGWYRDSPEDHHGPSMGWICTDCAAGHGMGRFEAQNIEKGLP